MANNFVEKASANDPTNYVEKDSANDVQVISKPTAAESNPSLSEEELEKLIDGGDVGAANVLNDQYTDAQKLFDDANVKKDYIFWYPHVEVGNRQQLLNQSDLEMYGAYHFEIYFAPETSSTNQTLNALAQENINKFDDGKNDSIEKIKESMKNNNGEATNTQGTMSAGYNLWNALTTGIVATFDIGVATLSQSTNAAIASNTASQKNPDIVASVPQYTFTGKSLKKAHIYLPLTKYSINRSTGIEEQEDVVSSVGAAMVKSAYNTVTGFMGGIATVPQNVAGATVRNFVAPRIKSPNLDKFELEWDLYARTYEEKVHIKNILRFFNANSVPNFNKKDFFYNMPPVIYMEIKTGNFSLGAELSTIKYLRPKRQYFMTNITINTSTDGEGNTLLDREGDPIYVNLKIQLIKADLTTSQELFVYPYM